MESRGREQGSFVHERERERKRGERETYKAREHEEQDKVENWLTWKQTKRKSVNVCVRYKTSFLAVQEIDLLKEVDQKRIKNNTRKRESKGVSKNNGEGIKRNKQEREQKTSDEMKERIKHEKVSGKQKVRNREREKKERMNV